MSLNKIKKLFIILLVAFMLPFVLKAQITQKDGPVTVNVESTKIIGNQYIIAGKLTVSKQLRLRNIEPKAIDSDGETLEAKNLWWTGKLTEIGIFDQNLEPEIPYSFILGIETKGKNLNSITAFNLKFQNHTEHTSVTIAFKGLPIPTKENPNLATAEMIEIENNVYLKWTKFEETKKSLKVHFVVQNQTNKEVAMRFTSYNNAKMFDNDGNQYEGTLSLKDEVKFQKDVPFAGFFEFNGEIKMNDLRLIKFKSNNFEYSVTKIEFPKKK